MILYGFASCGMVRSARKWLDANGVAHTFVDYRRTSLSAATIDDWFARANWEQVFNRNSTAYKELSAAEQASVTPAMAVELMLANTNFIKRPLLDTGAEILPGFKAAEWERALRELL
jgi:arsenate reductase